MVYRNLKKDIMKQIFSFYILLIATFIYAQQPEVSYKDLGFTKKIKKVETFTYSMEDKMVLDRSSDSYIFDENGNITNHEYHVYGKYASSTSENSIYENGLLVKREILVKDRPNFDAIITFQYDKKKNLVKKNYQSKLYKNDFIFSYDNKNQLIEIKGIYANNYSVEKFYYQKERLVKSINQYFSKDSIQSETIKLYIDDKVVIECNAKNKLFIAYLNEDLKNMVLKMNYPEPIQNLNGIETEITFEELSVFKLKEGLLNDRNKPFRLIEANEVKKQNEHKDWIAQAGVYFRHKKNENYYSFRKITYADGSVSGSTDFDIFTVNELNSKLHE